MRVKRNASGVELTHKGTRSDLSALNSQHSTLLIVGASVRAAAFSALRGGFSPHALDLFADADLRGCCAATRIESYPASLVTQLAAMPPAEWMYTGALENHAHVIDRIAQTRPLLGSAGPVLRRVRSPRRLAAALAKHGLLFPETRAAHEHVPRDGTWLRKPYRSAGGHGISVWDEKAAAGGARRAHYFQRRIEGTPMAAVYVAAAGRAELLGVTQQLTGTRWTGASGFRYSGSIGPLKLDDRENQSFRRLGDVLASTFRLEGLFGVDAIVEGDSVWTLEVNPRYTASVEVLERSLDLCAVAMHVEACRHGRLPAGGSVAARSAGKAILFARSATRVSESLLDEVHRQNGDSGLSWPLVADIPDPGTSIRAGSPVLTVLADGPDTMAVVQALRQRLARLEGLLYEQQPGQGAE